MNRVPSPWPQVRKWFAVLLVAALAEIDKWAGVIKTSGIHAD